jgi:hypothetical protein
MKGRRVSTAVLLVLTFLAGPSAAGEKKDSFKPSLSFRLMAEVNYLSVGDLNTFVASFDGFLKAPAGLGSYLGGKSKPIGRFSPAGEGELQWNFSPRLAVSAGSGYIYAKANSDFQAIGDFPMTVAGNPALWHLIWKQNVKAIPITASVLYSLPVTPRVSYFIKGGAACYFSSAYLLRRIELAGIVGYGIPESPLIVDEYKVRKIGLGVHGGAGLEFRISSNLAITLEAKGRYAKIRNLQAARIHRNDTVDQGQTFESGILYIGTRDLTSGGFAPDCPDLAIGPSPGMRKATLDFSGFSLIMGFRLRL